MTYKDYFVVEVKANGKVLRVRDDAVYLPFGSEYSILLKNLNSRKASVSVSVDGDDVLDNHSVLLEPNESTELQGFLRGNVVRNRFRFIHKTEQIQNHRGDRADDGMIRIEFAFEKPRPEPWIKKTIQEVHEIHHHHHPGYTYYDGSGWNNMSDQSVYSYGEVQGSGDASGPTGQNVQISNAVKTRGATASKNFSNQVVQDSLEIADVPLADEGITVKGSECHQQFRYGFIGELEPSEVIVIQLKGVTDAGSHINKPMTVKTKLRCPTCGITSKSSMKYCGSCGTFLE